MRLCCCAKAQRPVESQDVSLTASKDEAAENKAQDDAAVAAAEAVALAAKDLNREFRGQEAKRNLREALPDWSKSDLDREIRRHYPTYWQGLHVTSHQVLAEMLLEMGVATDGVRARPRVSKRPLAKYGVRAL